MFSLWPITAEQRKPREDPCVQEETRFVNRKRQSVNTGSGSAKLWKTCFPNARRRKEEQRLLVQWQHPSQPPAGQMATLQVYHRLVICHVRHCWNLYFIHLSAQLMSHWALWRITDILNCLPGKSIICEKIDKCVYIFHTSIMSVKPRCFMWRSLSCTVSQVNYFRLWDFLPFDFNLYKWLDYSSARQKWWPNIRGCFLIKGNTIEQSQRFVCNARNG